MKIRIATRKSELALWQARHVAARLAALGDVGEVVLVPLSTRGDEVLDRSLTRIGGKGLFIKELELAMQQGEADIAVHSMKDVPADIPAGFTVAAILPRAAPHDVLVTADGRRLDRLAAGALVGSSSLRRQAQLRMLRPDLRIEPLRGNVNTRLQRLMNGDFDAIVLAAAGLERLGLSERISQVFTTREMLPAAAQGAIGIECLEGDRKLLGLLRALSDPGTEATTRAERAVARVLEASCRSPVAAYAAIDGATMAVEALVALPDGSRFLRDAVTGAVADAESLGTALADRLLEAGAARLLADAEATDA